MDKITHNLKQTELALKEFSNSFKMISSSSKNITAESS